jgi:hypothetical protein
MKCQKCNEPIQKGQKFCMSCGELIDYSAVGGRSGFLDGIRGNTLKFGLIGLGLITIATLVIVFISSGVLSGGSNQIIFGVRDDLDAEEYETLYSIGLNGKKQIALYEDVPSGLYTSLLDGWPGIISPDGKYLQFFDDDDEQIVILELISQSVNKADVYSDEYLGSMITSDGKLVLVLEEEFSEPTEYVLHILDTDGVDVGTFEQFNYTDIYDKDNLTVIELDYDSDGYVEETGLGLLNIKTGDYNRVKSLSEERRGFVVTSWDKKHALYQDAYKLLLVDISSGDASTLFRGASDESYLRYSFSANNATVSVIDSGKSNTLYTIDVKKGTENIIDKFVIDTFFTNDNKYLVYTTDEGLSNVDIYRVKMDGSDKVRIAKDISNVEFRISPDGKYIAYLERYTYGSGSSLYVVDMNGENLVELDYDVWSFQFSEDSKRIIYSKVEDLNRGRPESEILSIDLKGKNARTIVEKDDGLIEILWPAPLSRYP